MTMTRADGEARGSSKLVVGVGAVSVDEVKVLPDYPEPSGPRAKLRILRQEVRCGGQNAVTLATCARLGLQARFAGVLGEDEHTAMIRGELGRRGVDLSAALVVNGRNQSAVILITEASGERIVLWTRDERLQLGSSLARPALLDGAAVVHVDDVDEEAAVAVARAARGLGIPTTSDIERSTPLTGSLLEAVTFPILAEALPPQLTGEDDPDRALRLLARRCGRTVSVTLGPHGAAAYDPEDDVFVREPGFEVDVVDTTGSGDVFRAGFIYGLVNGFPLPDRLRFANAAAAVSCTRLGALGGVPSLQEVEDLLRRQPRST